MSRVTFSVNLFFQSTWVITTLSDTLLHSFATPEMTTKINRYFTFIQTAITCASVGHLCQPLLPRVSFPLPASLRANKAVGLLMIIISSTFLIKKAAMIIYPQYQNTKTFKKVRISFERLCKSYKSTSWDTACHVAQLATAASLAIFSTSRLLFTTLSLLNLYNLCRLTTLPDSISQLTALKQLQAEKNLLRSLPNTIGELTALEELDLSDNPLTTFPDSISQLTSLQMLRLGSCHIESLPDAIGGLTALQCLFLYNNALSSLPSTIIQLTALKGLLLPFNRFKTFPSIVCTLTSLQGLWISHNQISSFPAELCNLPALIQLDFSSQSSNDTSANEVDWEEWLKKTFGD